MAYRVNFPDSFAGQPLRGQAGENPVMYATQWSHRAQLSRPRSCAIRLIFLALSIVMGIAAGDDTYSPTAGVGLLALVALVYLLGR